jgi:hypothetical protein
VARVMEEVTAVEVMDEGGVWGGGGGGRGDGGGFRRCGRIVTPVVHSFVWRFKA